MRTSSGVGLLGWCRGRPEGELLRPGQREPRIRRHRAHERGHLAAGRLHTVDAEPGGDGQLRLVELVLVINRVRLPEILLDGVELRVAPRASGVGRVVGVGRVDGKGGDGVLAVDALAERDDERLVGGDARLVGVVGPPVRLEGEGAAEADARDVKRHRGGRAHPQHVPEERRGDVGGRRRDDLHHPVIGEVGVGEDGRVDDRRVLGRVAREVIRRAEEEAEERLVIADAVRRRGGVVEDDRRRLGAARGDGDRIGPDHEAGTGGIERLGQGRLRERIEGEGLDGAARGKAVDRAAVVLHLQLVEIRQQRHLRGRHHVRVGRHRLGEGLSARHQVPDGEREGVFQRLDHPRLVGRGDVHVLETGVEVVAEHVEVHLVLLEGVAEELDHPLFELRSRHPLIDETAQGGGIRRHRGDLGVGGGETGGERLHLGDVRGSADRLEGDRRRTGDRRGRDARRVAGAGVAAFTGGRREAGELVGVVARACDESQGGGDDEKKGAHGRSPVPLLQQRSCRPRARCSGEQTAPFVGRRARHRRSHASPGRATSDVAVSSAGHFALRRCR